MQNKKINKNMIDLRKFRVITKKEQLRSTDFLVIINTHTITQQSMDVVGKRNVIRYKDKDYQVSILKGLFSNFLQRSKDLLADKEVSEKFAGYGFLVAGVADDGLMEVYYHKTLQAFINDNAVYAYHKRIEGEIAMDDEIMDYVISKGSFYSEGVN